MELSRDVKFHISTEVCIFSCLHIYFSPKIKFLETKNYNVWTKLDGINSRLHIAEEKISELENIAMENYPKWNTERKKHRKEIMGQFQVV